jgi:hypothetical protein
MQSGSELSFYGFRTNGFTTGWKTKQEICFILNSISIFSSKKKQAEDY